MQKITAKYLGWKTVIHFLLLIMVSAPILPVALLLHAAVGPNLYPKILSCAAFLIFLLLQRWLIGRSDLSHISRSLYVTGEGIAYGFLTLLGCAVLCVFSKGLSPSHFSYLLLPFLPVLPLCYLTGNIAVGFLLQCVLYFPCAALLYALKKRKDPSLRGRDSEKGKKSEKSEDLLKNRFDSAVGTDAEDGENGKGSKGDKSENVQNPQANERDKVNERGQKGAEGESDEGDVGKEEELDPETPPGDSAQSVTQAVRDRPGKGTRDD